MDVKLRNLIFVAIIVCVSTTTATRIYTQVMKVERNGYIANTSLLNCNNKGRIKLLLYEYHHCETSQSCSTPLKTNLSSAAKLIIHEMCSLKKACVNAKFPEADLQPFTAVNVKYQCLGQFTMSLDICANTTRQTDSPVHLTYKKNSVHLYERCQCKIDNGELLLSDVRLKSASSGNCSLNKLYLSSQEFSCNATSDDYGSVFERNAKKDTEQHFVIFASDPLHVEPKMVYLTIKPTGTDPLSISCQNKPWPVISSTVIAYGTNTSSITDKESKSTTTTSEMVGVGVCVGLVLVCIGFYVGYRFWNRKATKRFNYLERLFEMYITRSYNPSRSQTRHCRTEDEGVYVDLKTPATGVKDISHRVGNRDDMVQSTDSKYDRINEQNLNDCGLSSSEHTNIYSYVTHQPVIRPAQSLDICTGSCKSESRIDRARDDASDAINSNCPDANFSTNSELLREKHKYVVLLPVCDSEANTINDNRFNQGHLNGRKEMRDPDTSCSKSSGEKNVKKKNGGSQGAKGYSFAVDPCQKSMSSLFNKLNQTKIQTYSGSQNVGPVSKQKDAKRTADISVRRENQELSPNIKNNEIGANTAIYNKRYETIDINNVNNIRAPRDSKVGSLLQKVARMVPGIGKRSAQLNIKTTNESNCMSNIKTKSPVQENNSPTDIKPKVDKTSSFCKQYDSTNIAETKQADDQNYNHITKCDVTESRLRSDEEQYDRTDVNKIMKLSHPNYNKISM